MDRIRGWGVKVVAGWCENSFLLFLFVCGWVGGGGHLDKKVVGVTLYTGVQIY